MVLWSSAIATQENYFGLLMAPNLLLGFNQAENHCFFNIFNAFFSFFFLNQVYPATLICLHQLKQVLLQINSRYIEAGPIGNGS